MNRPRPIQHRLERILHAALEQPLAFEEPFAGRLQRLFERMDDNLVEI